MDPQSNIPIKKPKEKHKYVFPNIMAKTMKNVPMNVQLESSMAASSMILMGMILMAILLTFFTQQTIAFKLITLLNLVGAFIFISSSLVTTYQQYVSYMDVMDLQKSMAIQGASLNGMPDLAIDDLKMKHTINRKNQILFFGGLLLIIVPMFTGKWIDSLLPEITYVKYLIMALGIIIGISMIYFAIRKKKVKIIKKKILTPTNPQIPQPIQNVDTMQQLSTASAPTLRFASAPKQKPEALKATYVEPQSVPVSRPIPAPLQQRPILLKSIQKPLQEPLQKPIERSQRPQRLQQVQIQPQRQIQRVNRPIEKTIQQTQPKLRLLKKFGISKDNKKNNMLNNIEKSMEDKLYEINMLKSKQR